MSEEVETSVETTAVVETALEAPSVEEGARVMVNEITDMGPYQGETLADKVQTLIDSHGVVMFGKTYCPFCLDAQEFLTEQMGSVIYVVQVDAIPEGTEIFQIVKSKTDHKTVPVIFIKGVYTGGCDDVKSLHTKGLLEDRLGSLRQDKKTMDTDTLETAKLVPVKRGTARNPLFWFPNVVNNYVVRLTGLQVFILSIVSAAFHNELWGRYLAVGLLIDFGIRFMVGSSLSPLGMISAVVVSPFRPQFKPGAPKQFAASCGIIFTLIATIFYFVGFEGHAIVGAVFMAMLAGAAGLEAFLDFCLGCVFFSYGIQFGIFPDSVYRIYTSIKQEVEDTWDYVFTDSKAPRPERVDTDPSSPVALKYKKKTDEWTKDDFHVIRNMKVSNFGMPLAIAGLATAFKIASDWNGLPKDQGFTSVPDAWFVTFSVIAAVVFIIMLCLYTMRAVFYPHKVATEWDCPLRSPSFGTITISFMLFGFLMYDQIQEPDSFDKENPQVFARVIYWMGAVAHCLLTVAKTGEWIGKRLEMEHVHPHWMILPVGLSVAALVGTIIPMFVVDPDNENNHEEANTFVARFFYSFAFLMWITLFVITFLKVVTTHNSDPRNRHGVWIWLAAPCVIGLADVSICLAESFKSADECEANFANYYFIGQFIFLSLLWATFPYIGFFGKDGFGMGYWTECFALDTLAACAAFFYALNGFKASETLMFIGLTMAAIANLVAFCHTLVALIRRRGVFTPDGKWGPLSFMKLTHEAFRGNMATLQAVINKIDIKDKSFEGEQNIGFFAAHFNRFCIVHSEHAKHEDQVIFKTFNDYFSCHCKVYNEDHQEDHIKLESWRVLSNKLLDTKLSDEERQDAVDTLRRDLVPFWDHFQKHLRGEEDNLNPIGRKHIPLELQKQISREVFRITSAEKWEIIIPFVLNNLPRQMQRVRYMRVLCWSMPERAQQIGAIVYRNVDAVMWERLRGEVPEIIPRAAPGWRRYY